MAARGRIAGGGGGLAGVARLDPQDDARTLVEGGHVPRRVHRDHARAHARDSSTKNPLAKHTPMTPPFSARPRICSSVKLRRWSLRARHEEWLAKGLRVAMARTSA